MSKSCCYYNTYSYRSVLQTDIQASSAYNSNPWYPPQKCVMINPSPLCLDAYFPDDPLLMDNATLSVINDSEGPFNSTDVLQTLGSDYYYRCVPTGMYNRFLSVSNVPTASAVMLGWGPIVSRWSPHWNQSAGKINMKNGIQVRVPYVDIDIQFPRSGARNMNSIPQIAIGIVKNTQGPNDQAHPFSNIDFGNYTSSVGWNDDSREIKVLHGPGKVRVYAPPHALNFYTTPPGTVDSEDGTPITTDNDAKLMYPWGPQNGGERVIKQSNNYPFLSRGNIGKIFIMPIMPNAKALYGTPMGMPSNYAAGTVVRDMRVRVDVCAQFTWEAENDDEPRDTQNNFQEMDDAAWNELRAGSQERIFVQYDPFKEFTNDLMHQFC